MKQKYFLKIAFCFLLISNFSYGQLVTTIDFETEDDGYTPSIQTGSGSHLLTHLTEQIQVLRW